MGQLELLFRALFASGSDIRSRLRTLAPSFIRLESTRKWKSQGAKVPGSQERMVLGVKSPDTVKMILEDIDRVRTY